MAGTSVETTPQRAPARAGSAAGWPQGLPPQLPPIEPPLDARKQASLVASRITLARRPPALALALPEPLHPRSQPPGSRGVLIDGQLEIDLGAVSSLSPDVLAWRVIELSARLLDRPDLAAEPSAHAGLGTLDLQSRMFQHLQILQNAAAEGLA